MPWQLTNSVQVGDLDTAPYQQIKIIEMKQNAVIGFITVAMEYGNTVDGVWHAGMIPHGKVNIANIEGTDYATLVSTATPNQGELVYDAVKRTLYEWLAAHNIIGAGSVV